MALTKPSSNQRSQCADTSLDFGLGDGFVPWTKGTKKPGPAFNLMGEVIMKRISNWQRLSGKCALVFGLGTLASMTANPALADCSQYNPAAPPPHWGTPGKEGERLIEAVYRPGSERFIRVGHETSVAN